MKIGIMGVAVDSGNRGVLALGASLLDLCCGRADGRADDAFLLITNRSGVPVMFRVGGHPVPVPVVNCRMSPRSKAMEHMLAIVALSVIYRLVPSPGFRSWLRSKSRWMAAVSGASCVGDVRGGDSFSDIYGMKRFVLACLPVWSVLLVRGAMVQFPQTYGPFRSPLARAMARYILRRSSVVVARDKRSREVARELLGPGREVLLSPDVAFSLDVVRPEFVASDPPSAGRVPAGTVGLNVNGLVYRGGYTQSNMFGLRLDYAVFLRCLVEALLRAQPGELWLVPHTYAPDGDVESDPAASRALRASLPADLRERVRIVTGEYDAHELKGIIGQCDFFVGSRMHACIAALSQGVPCVGVAYSMKFAGVFESVGMGDWVVDGRATTNEEAVARILALYAGREAVRAPLRAAGERAREELKAVFHEILTAGSREVDGAVDSRPF